MNLTHLKAPCERAQPAYENPCYVESENKTLHLFAQEFSPEFCLKLLSIIEIQRKALLGVDWAIKNCDWECERCSFDPKMDDCDFVAECREALTAVDRILVEV